MDFTGLLDSVDHGTAADTDKQEYIYWKAYIIKHKKHGTYGTFYTQSERTIFKKKTFILL